MFARTDDASDPFEMEWTFDAPTAEVSDLVTCTFQRCGADLKRFTDRQVALGLQAIVFGDYSGIVHRLMGKGPEEPQRIALIASLAALYRDCLSVRSPPVLGHLSGRSQGSLAYVTYMLWDASPLDVMAVKTPERLDALIAVLNAALRLANPACVESALHGLGHLGAGAFDRDIVRQRARRTIEDWLAQGPAVPPELISYAQKARERRIA